MRILYVATDQTVPGSLGGSVHVEAVAEGLARLGHEVHVACQVRVEPRAPSPEPQAGLSRDWRRRLACRSSAGHVAAR